MAMPVHLPLRRFVIRITAELRSPFCLDFAADRRDAGTAMPERTSLEATCRECHRPLSFHAGETQPARCSECFDGFMQARDIEFLSSYAELGVTSRRIIAETCLRALVTESPPARKVLAMNIMEQYVQAAGDLVGLVYALRQRGRQPIMRALLGFKLDRASAVAFFQELAITSQADFLESLGLPMPDQVRHRFKSLSKGDARDLACAMTQMLGDLTRTGEMGEGVALALAQASGEARGGAAITRQSTWLDSIGLKPNQVAAIGIDEQRRTINITTISVDEKRLQSIVSVIGAMANISSTLVYATLTAHQEGERQRRSARTV